MDTDQRYKAFVRLESTEEAKRQGYDSIGEPGIITDDTVERITREAGEDYIRGEEFDSFRKKYGEDIEAFVLNGEPITTHEDSPSGRIRVHAIQFYRKQNRRAEDSK